MTNIFVIPKSDRIEFERNPLISVSVQFNFPKLLEIGEYVPVLFHKRVRDQFPFFSDQENASLGIELGADGSVKSQTSKRTAYIFHSMNKTTSVQLNDEFLSFTTNEYVRWTDFRRDIVYCLSAFIDTYLPKSFGRVGVRCQNVIDKDELGLNNLPWSELIDEKLFPLLAHNEVPAEAIIGLTSTVELRIPGANLTIRQAAVEEKSSKRRALLLDADFSNGDFGEATVDDAIKRADTLNEHTGNFFRWCIKKPLQDALGKRTNI